jgi:hypothetical protein
MHVQLELPLRHDVRPAAIQYRVCSWTETNTRIAYPVAPAMQTTNPRNKIEWKTPSVMFVLYTSNLLFLNHPFPFLTLALLS